MRTIRTIFAVVFSVLSTIIITMAAIAWNNNGAPCGSIVTGCAMFTVICCALWASCDVYLKEKDQ